jgi:hypothetical protein
MMTVNEDAMVDMSQELETGQLSQRKEEGESRKVYIFFCCAIKRLQWSEYSTCL